MFQKALLLVGNAFFIAGLLVKTIQNQIRRIIKNENL
jgi:hypothetical protein